MRPLTGAIVADFHADGSDLLVVTRDGEFKFLDGGEFEDAPHAYTYAHTRDGEEVQVLLERSVIEAGDWFPDALDSGTLTAAVAEEMAQIITADGLLPSRVAKVTEETNAWANANAATNALALRRARAIADVVTLTGGNQSEAGRLLRLNQAVVNRMLRKVSEADAKDRERSDIDSCTCVEYCDEDPQTACSLSGTPHVHPPTPGLPGITGPCPVHPGRPGDH